MCPNGGISDQQAVAEVPAISIQPRRGPGLLRVSLPIRTAKLVVVDLAGEIDLASCGDLRESLQVAVEIVRRGGRVVVDLSGVSFLAVCGLRCLLEADVALRARDVQLGVVANTQAVRIPLTTLRQTRPLRVFSSLALACA